MARRSISHFRRNWRDSPDPFLVKLGKAVANQARKTLTAQTCCGHPGEPGC